MASNRSRLNRGFTMMEAVMAALIMAVAITGVYRCFTSALVQTRDAEYGTMAGQLARAEIERAKVYGMTDLPLGTYSTATQTATWTGVYDATANSNAGGWVSGETAYFDKSGNRLYSATGAVLSISDTFIDSNVVPSSNTYTYQLQSEKSMVVTVKTTVNGVALFTAGTNIVTGGL